MADMKQHLAVGSTAFIIGAVVPALISLNIFARTEAIAELETKMYRDFIQKQDLQKMIDGLDKRLETIDNKIEKLTERK